MKKQTNWFIISEISWCLFLFLVVIFIAVSCDIQSTQDQIDTENSSWIFLGESILTKATAVYDDNGYWEHWHLEFENGIVLNTREWETKPYWVGQRYSIYYNPNNRKTFLEMK